MWTWRSGVLGGPGAVAVGGDRGGGVFELRPQLAEAFRLQLLDDLPEAIVVLGRCGRIREVNANTVELTAKVKSLNLKRHRATLEFPDGKSKTFDVLDSKRERSIVRSSTVSGRS